MAVDGQAGAGLWWQSRLAAAELALEVAEAQRSAACERQLRQVLDLAAVLHAEPYGAPGTDREAFVIAQLALLLRCSEARAGELLRTARGLTELPGALGCALLTVEQATTTVRSLAVLELADRLTVWRRLQQLLVQDADGGTVRPPARLAERLRRWVVEADSDAAARRRRAHAERRVDYRRREDGLVDLTVFGIEPLQARAVLSRIARSAAPWVGDERTADQRRADAAVDLLLGRVGSCTGDRAACGCLPGDGAPCGAEVMVLLPLGAALGSTDEVGELVGHGPLDREQTEAVLRAAPRLHPVRVDEHGVPVTVGRPVRLPRDDGTAARGAVRRWAEQHPPEQRFPQHPEDHADSEGHGLEHPPDDPGSYGVPPRLHRLIRVRAPLCEWAGCGHPAPSCDSEHDNAWPHGPTCACNLGPLCRRHHRLKQLLLALGGRKTRGEHALVSWTSPSGRTWTGPAPHAPPSSRPARPRRADPLDDLLGHELVALLHRTGQVPDSTAPPPVDSDPDEPDRDRLEVRLLDSDTRWDLDLADHTAW